MPFYNVSVAFGHEMVAVIQSDLGQGDQVWYSHPLVLDTAPLLETESEAASILLIWGRFFLLCFKEHSIHISHNI